jgi:hypothetical protein
MKSSRLQVYPCGDGLALSTTNLPGARTVCSVIAAGNATMTSMAATSHALNRGEGELPCRAIRFSHECA